MVLTLKILSVIVAALGAYVGVAHNFRYDEGAKKGRVTKAGRLAVILLVAGLGINIGITAVEAIGAREAQRKLLYERVLNIQGRPVQKVRVTVHGSDNYRDLEQPWAVLVEIKNNSLDEYWFNIPMVLDKSLKSGVFFQDNQLPSKTILTNGLVSFVEVKNSALSFDKQLLLTVGNLSGINCYISFSHKLDSGDEEIDFDKLIDMIDAIAIDLDNIRVADCKSGKITVTTDRWLENEQEKIHQVRFQTIIPDWKTLAKALYATERTLLPNF